ncbi:phosphatase methylesterase 1-like protein [Labeo rohita]|uniref:Phosphatase methylesterase 1-like protein n=1 Tax=Labeo rohita TaxID=84645 RepID=A0A498NRF3_LABRO|nr:phosphatase methylesterase 1-like protein [Labeo rohita]
MASERSSAESRSSHLSSDPTIGTDASANSMWEESFDTENHGVSTKRDYSPVSWSEYFEMMDDVVIGDVANVVRATYGEIPPSIILVGHNMGGAIAVHAASGALLPSVVGLVAIDVVEGSAMDVLHSMQNFLRGRPKSFKSIDHAIEWSVKSGQIRNLESAKVSMVGQVRRCEVDEGDSAEPVSPVTESVAEGHEEFYDLNYVTDKAESSTSAEVADALASFMIRHKFAEARSETKSSSYPFMR